MIIHLFICLNLSTYYGPGTGVGREEEREKEGRRERGSEPEKEHMSFTIRLGKCVGAVGTERTVSDVKFLLKRVGN